MKIAVFYWENFEQRILVLDKSGYLKSVSFEGIESIQSNVPLVEIDLPLTIAIDEEASITVPIETAITVVHNTLVLR